MHLNKNEIIFDNQLCLKTLTKENQSSNYLLWLNNQHLTKWVDGLRGKSFKQKEINLYIDSARKNASFHLWGIFLENKHIGNITISEYSESNNTCIFGILIGETSAHGKGIATNSIKALAKFCANELHIHRIQAMCYPENEASKKAFCKAGFQIEGTLRDCRVIDKKRHSLLLLSKVKQ